MKGERPERGKILENGETRPLACVLCIVSDAAQAPGSLQTQAAAGCRALAGVTRAGRSPPTLSSFYCVPILGGA